MSTKNNIQDTYVLGLNELNEIAFFKTYNYESEKDEAQKDLEHIRQQGLTWEIGELKNKIQDLLNINKKWNDLEAQIATYYEEDEDGCTQYEWCLTEIGEDAAGAFGFM